MELPVEPTSPMICPCRTGAPGTVVDAILLNRRPLQGGGQNISSPFGWRIHPIFHTRKFHEGVDFASQTGVPIYAAADGVVERAGWSAGYGSLSCRSTSMALKRGMGI